MNNTIDMTYASQNDCAELSPVVADPEIFLVRRSILSCARPTVAGSTPARSSRAFTASRPSTPRSSSMSRNEDTFAARYSAAPVSTVRSARMRSPSSRLRPTSRVKESNSPARGADRATIMKVLPRASESATRAPNPDVVPSTTTMALVPPAAAKCRGMMMIAAKKRGPRMAETQNHLLRTRSTNSRRITARILRTHRLRPDQVDEDLVQRRLLQLEPGQPRPRCHESLEDLLGVGAGRELDLGILPIVVHVAHQGLVCEHLRRPTQAPIEPEDEMVPTMCPLDVRERAVHQLPSARDDAQLLAQLLGLLHDVGREQDRLPATAQVEHRVLHHLSIDGIEPREGLVENQEIRVVEHGRNELHLLLHPLGQLVDPSQSPIGEAESREPFLSPLTRPPSIGAFHLAEKDENVEHPHLAVQAALLGEVADPLRVGSPPARLAEYAHGAAVGFFFQAEDGIRGLYVTGVQTCALPIYMSDPKITELDLPPHFTNIQHALHLARRFLSVQDTPNRQIVIITDGLPTAHFEGEMLYLLYPPTEQTEEATLREAMLCAREGITINMFLLASWNQTPEDVRFAYKMVESTKGRVF